MASGQRNYFYEQKENYLNQIDKLTSLYDKNRFKKKFYKKRCKEIQENADVNIERLEKDIRYFREKVIIKKQNKIK